MMMSKYPPDGFVASNLITFPPDNARLMASLDRLIAFREKQDALEHISGADAAKELAALTGAA